MPVNTYLKQCKVKDEMIKTGRDKVESIEKHTTDFLKKKFENEKQEGEKEKRNLTNQLIKEQQYGQTIDINNDKDNKNDKNILFKLSNKIKIMKQNNQNLQKQISEREELICNLRNNIMKQTKAGIEGIDTRITSKIGNDTDKNVMIEASFQDIQGYYKIGNMLKNKLEGEIKIINSFNALGEYSVRPLYNAIENYEKEIIGLKTEIYNNGYNL